MIVDDVEKDHQAVTVRRVDQRLQIVGRAVAAFGREGQHAVVAPIARAGKFRDRHQLDRGDAEVGKPRQFAHDAGKAAEHSRHAAHRAPFRATAGRAISADASDTTQDRRRRWRRGLVRPARARPDRERGAVLQDISIARAGAAIDFGREPAVVVALHRHVAAALRSATDNRLLRGRPNPKLGSVGSIRFAPNGRRQSALSPQSVLQFANKPVRRCARTHARFFLSLRSNASTSGCAVSIRMRAGQSGLGQIEIASSPVGLSRNVRM